MKNKICILVFVLVVVSLLFTGCAPYETSKTHWNAICPNWEHEVELVISRTFTPYYVLYPSGEEVKIPANTCVLIEIK